MPKSPLVTLIASLGFYVHFFCHMIYIVTRLVVSSLLLLLCQIFPIILIMIMIQGALQYARGHAKSGISNQVFSTVSSGDRNQNNIKIQ